MKIRSCFQPLVPVGWYGIPLGTLVRRWANNNVGATFLKKNIVSLFPFYSVEIP